MTARRWDPRVEPPPECPNPDGRTDRQHDVRELGSLGLEIGTGYECHGCWHRFRVTPAGEVLAGYSKTSSSFQKALGALRSGGLVEGPGHQLRATDDGIRAIGRDFEPMPKGAALARLWLGHHALGKAERAMLSAFLEHPRGLDKDRLADLSGYSATSSSYQKAIGRLRSIELVSTVSPGVNAAHADFFA